MTLKWHKFIGQKKWSVQTQNFIQPLLLIRKNYKTYNISTGCKHHAGGQGQLDLFKVNWTCFLGLNPSYFDTVAYMGLIYLWGVVISP